MSCCKIAITLITEIDQNEHQRNTRSVVDGLERVDLGKMNLQLIARCPRFAPVLWALTWAPPYSGGHVRCAPRTLRRLEFHTAKNHCVPPNFFHHIFPVRSSQTCTTIAEKIPRQCTIENCASLQRRTRFRPQLFTCSLTINDNKWPRPAHPQVHAKQQNSTLSPIF